MSDRFAESGFDPYREFVRNVPRMVQTAREEARENGLSPRKFLVGAAVMAVQSDTHEMKIFHAANTKRKNKNKVCAEQRALGRVKKDGSSFDTAIGIVVAGPSSPEEIGTVTEIVTPTLHPCIECQNDFHDHDLVSDDTLILTAGLDADMYQVQSIAEVRHHHSENNTYRIDAPVMPLHDGSWERRIDVYETLRAAEANMPKNSQRPSQLLAQLALITKLV